MEVSPKAETPIEYSVKKRDKIQIAPLKYRYLHFNIYTASAAGIFCNDNLLINAFFKL